MQFIHRGLEPQKIPSLGQTAFLTGFSKAPFGSSGVFRWLPKAQQISFHLFPVRSQKNDIVPLTLQGLTIGLTSCLISK